MPYKVLLFLFLTTSLVACGGSSSNDDASQLVTEPDLEQTSDEPTTTPDPETLPDDTDDMKTETYTGMFLDSAVEGLSYTTETQSGKTTTLGEFSFQTGELITFSIGDIVLPAVAAELYLTPLELFDTEDINHIQVVNLLRLLQSLDADGDTSNGIEITEDTHQAAASITLDFSADDFEQHASNLVAKSGVINESLISSQMAIDHFQLTLDELNNSTISNCSTNHEKVGHSGYFSTLAHNVSGLATIIDDCTISITEFSYDGGGPEVYFYGAKEHQYASDDAFALGTKLTGTVYNNDSITLKLPQGKSLDDLTGLSVWCVDFDANFGQMEFTP